MTIGKSDIINYLAGLPDDQFFSLIGPLAQTVTPAIADIQTTSWNNQITALNSQISAIQGQISSLTNTQPVS